MGTSWGYLYVQARALHGGMLLSHLGAALHPHSGAPRPKPLSQNPFGFLKGNVEFCDQEINVVLFLQLKGFSDDTGGFPMLFAP